MYRVDKYLWAVRIFKTRGDATEACRSGRVRINGTEAKASREIRREDVVEVRKSMVTYRFRVVEPVDKRQSAKLVDGYAEDITPPEELDKLNIPKESFFLYRKRGTGRPTKKERREMENLFDSLDGD